MYYNQSSENSWPNDRYHHYPQHNDHRNNNNNNNNNNNRAQQRQDYSGYRNQEDWARQSYNPFGENRNRVPQLHNRWEEERFQHDRYRPNHPENYPLHPYDNRREHFNDGARNRQHHFDRRNERPYNPNNQYGPNNGAEGGKYEHDRYQQPPQQHQQHNHHNGALAAGRVGGSFTSYSASRSRTGSMGHGRSGGMLYREGPGMNSYSHGDINANSNW